MSNKQIYGYIRVLLVSILILLTMVVFGFILIGAYIRSANSNNLIWIRDFTVMNVISGRMELDYPLLVLAGVFTLIIILSMYALQGKEKKKIIPEPVNTVNTQQ